MNNKYIIGTSAGLLITVVTTWFTWRTANEKTGVIWHDQGPIVECERVDTYPEAVEFAEALAKFTDQRFENGSSYHYVISGPFVIQLQPDSAISYHASGMNEPSIGVCNVRTDDQAWNLSTYHTAQRLLYELNDRHDLQFSLGHYHTAKNGKEDPRPFKNWMFRDSLFWDVRNEPEFTWLVGPPQWLR